MKFCFIQGNSRGKVNIFGGARATPDFCMYVLPIEKKSRERSTQLPGRSDVSPSATTPCLLQACAMLLSPDGR